MIDGVLKEIGLTDSEIKVYLSLLELGDSTRTRIVKNSKIAGSKVYDVLEKLSQKGLVAIYIKNNIKHFKAVNPKQVINYLEEKKNSIINLENDATKILPQLLARFNSSKEEKEVELVTGRKGMEMIFYEQVDLLKRGEACYVIGGTVGSSDEQIMPFFERIHDLREKKGIKTYMLYNKRQEKQLKGSINDKKFPCTKTRFIEHSAPVAINIYKDLTVIILWGREITCVKIKSKDIAESFMEYFRMLWK